MIPINKETINKFLKKLHQRGESPSLIIKKLIIVDKFLTWAYQNNLIKENILKQIKEEIENIMSKITDQNLKQETNFFTESPKVIPPLSSFEKAAYAGEKKTEGIFGEISLRFNLQTYKIKSFLFGLLKKVPLLDSRFSGNEKEEIKEKKAPSGFDFSNFGIHHYIGLLFFLVFLGFLGTGLYNKFFLKVERPLAYPINLTRGGRVLSFQGRLTDSLGNPITTATNVQFKLYNVSTGGIPLYTAGPCSITPDQDGIFSTLIGQSCGSEIPNSIFTENPNVYLGVTVGADSEMTPRQPIANVGYAINAETLQGFPPGEGTSNIPFINKDGDLLIAVASPGIRSTFTSADFTLSSAKTAIIQSAGSGDVILQATESGALRFRTGGNNDTYTRMIINNGGNVGIGTTSPNQTLSVAGTLGILEGGALPQYYTIFQGGDQSANITYTLPTSIVANGFLRTDASGVLSWTTTIPATSVAWSNLTNPTANLSLNHNEYTTSFTWDTDAIAGAFTGLTLSLTNDATTDTNIQRILALQNNSATGGTTENLLYLNNADNNAVTSAIVIDNTGGGGFTNFLDTPSIDITGTGAITGATGISSSGIITFSGLTANRLVTTDGSSNLTTSISSSNVAASVTDETGTGNLVFSTSPTFTNSVLTGSSSFSVFNTIATTVNAFGAATTLNMGANSGTLTIGNPTVVGTQSTQNLWNTTASTINFGGAATTLNMGASSGIATINNTTLSLPNATSVTIGGASSVLNFSSTTGVKQIQTGGTTNLALMPGGNVGIGTTSPNQRLSVAGTFGILEGGASPQYYTIFQGGDQSANITYTLPTSIVANGFLRTDASGVLSWTTNISATSLKWNALTDPDGNLTLNHGTYTTTFNTSSTTGTFFTINANSLTSGKGLYLSSTSTGLTGNLSEFVLSGSDAGNTGNVVRIAQTGTSSAAVPLMITNLGTGLSFRVNDETGDSDTTPFVIDASGNVGIGTTNPSTFKLEVAGSVGPSADNTYDLGSSSLRWANIYGTNIYGNITPTGFTQGSVIFAGAGGTLFQDNANFFWDDNNNRLGIGTAVPSQTLEVVGSIALQNSNILTGVTNYVRFSQGISVGGADTYYFNSSGNINVNLIGVGTATPNTSRNINSANTFTDISASGFYNTITASGTITADRTSYGIYNLITNNADQNKFNLTLRGIYSQVTNANGYSADTIYGGHFYALNQSTYLNPDLNLTATNSAGLVAQAINDVNGTITNQYGIQAYSRNDEGTIINSWGLDAYSFANVAGGTITTSYGVRGRSYVTAGTITTGYGGYFTSTGATTNYGVYASGTEYGIYSAGGTNYFSGNVGIGTTSPSQNLHISGNMRLTGALYDVNNEAGTSGQVLSSIGSGVDWIDAGGLPVRWSSLTNPNANLTLHHSTYTTTFNTSSTTGTFFTINANSLTSGKGLYLSSTSTGLTGNLSEFVLSGSDAGNTGNVVRIAQTGTSSAAVPLMITNLGTGLSFRVNDETGDSDTTPFVIDASGNVGIGTTSPGTNKLYVNGGDVYMTNDLRAARFIDITGSNAYYLDPANGGNSLVIAGNIVSRSPTPYITGFDGTNYNTLILVGSDSSTSTSVCISYSNEPASCSGKIDAGTIDPPYTINGKKYATYVSSMTGVKEETTGVIEITSKNKKLNAYEYIIDFAKQKEGSDLWLFSKTTNLRKNIDKMTVLLTPSKNTRVWYKIDKEKFALFIYSTKPTTISYRLTAPRFDYEKWANENPNGPNGFVINDPDLPSLLTLDKNGNLQEAAVTLTSTPSGQTGDLWQDLTNKVYQLAGATQDLIEEIGYFQKILVAKIQTGLLQAEEVLAKNLLVAKNIVAENINLTTKNITIAGKTIERFIDERIETFVNLRLISFNSQKIISPVVETTNLKATGEASLKTISTNEIKPQEKDLVINLDSEAKIPVSNNLGGAQQNDSEASTPTEVRNTVSSDRKGQLAKIIIKGLEGKTAVTIDAAGNASFSGQISSSSIVSDLGDLGNLKVNKDATISGNLTANTLNATEASVSGKIIAKEIEAENINEIQRLLAEIKNQPLPNLSNLSNLSNLTNLSDLTVTGQSNLYNVSVSGSLLVGQTFVENNSITTLASELKLSALEKITLFDGAVNIAKDGTITTKGEIIAQGGIKTSKITPLEKDLSVLGNLSILGELKLKKATGSAVIAAPDNLAKNGIFAPAIEASASAAGTGIIPKTSQEVIIYSSFAKPTSLIYLTPKTAQPISLSVFDKKDGFFRVIRNELLDQDITFDWLIIN